MNIIVPLVKKLSIVEAQKVIREFAEQGRISWSKHSKLRMSQRNITVMQIINCLLKGRVTEPPIFSHSNGGGYETKVEKITAGDSLKVVVCLKLTQRLLVVTVYK